MRKFGLLATCAGALLLSGTVANAAFIVEGYSDGLGFSNFSFGGSTTSASASSVESTAVGIQGTSSIFGGAPGTDHDTYVFSYTPGTDADNYSPAPGTVLGDKSGNAGEGNLASGLVGGVTGTYRVYFTSPETTNISGGPTTFTITQNGSPVVVGGVDLNNGGTGPDTNPSTGFTGGANNSWHLLATVNLVAGNTYSVTMDSTSATFVSQRAQGVMWEAVPEPGSLALLSLGGLALIRRRRH